MDPSRGPEFAQLTERGKLYYADRRSEGADHALAMSDARHSYGTRADK